MSDTKVEFKLNRSGVRDVLQSQMMMDAIMAEAQKVGEVDSSYVGFDRVQVVVKQEGE